MKTFASPIFFRYSPRRAWRLKWISFRAVFKHILKGINESKYFSEIPTMMPRWCWSTTSRLHCDILKNGKNWKGHLSAWAERQAKKVANFELFHSSPNLFLYFSLFNKLLLKSDDRKLCTTVNVLPGEKRKITFSSRI